MKKFRSMLLVLLAAAAMVFAAGCSKERETELPDGQKQLYFQVADLQGLVLDVKTAGENGNELDPISKAVGDDGSDFRADLEFTKHKVASVSTGDWRIRQIFNNFWVEGRPGTTYQFKFELDEQYVRIYKLVTDLEELPTHERIWATVPELGNPRADGFYYVPQLRFKIKAYGTLEVVKNDLDEETKNYRFQPQEYGTADYVFVSFESGEEYDGLRGVKELTRERYFLTDRLNGKILEASTIADHLDIELGALEIDDIVYSAFSEDSLLSLYKIKHISTISHEALEVLKMEELGIVAPTSVRRCTAEVLREINTIVEKRNMDKAEEYKTDLFTEETCVMSLNNSIQVDYLTPKVESDATGVVNLDGFRTVKVSDENPLNEIKLVQIKKTADVSTYTTESYNVALDRKRNIRVKDFKGKEFLYRRVIQDVPNKMYYGIPGYGLDLEIVTFDFRENRVDIKRSKPLTPTGGITETDTEILMSFAVSYKRQAFRDENGRLHYNPHWEDTTVDNPEAYAIIDWTRNTASEVTSMIELYFSPCFGGKSTEEVLDFERDMRNNSFSFTMATTFEIANGYCADLSMDSGRMHLNYTFKERVAFKEYRPEAKYNDEDPLISIPYLAQKKLGFALFTTTKDTPDSYGDVDKEGGKTPISTIYDIRNPNKQVKYVLAGIPTSEENDKLRQMIIQATVEVIDELNVGFRRVLEDTPLERAGDVVKLEIEGLSDEEVEKYGVANAEKKILGDLDRNFIYYIPKQSKGGTFGLGGNHHNPRNGKVETGSIYVFGGNLWRFIDWYRDQHMARTKYRQTMGIEDDYVTLDEYAAGKSLSEIGKTKEKAASDLMVDLAALSEKSNAEAFAPLAYSVNKSGIKSELNASNLNLVKKIAAFTKSPSESQLEAINSMADDKTRIVKEAMDKLMAEGKLMNPGAVMSAFSELENSPEARLEAKHAGEREEFYNRVFAEVNTRYGFDRHGFSENMIVDFKKRITADTPDELIFIEGYKPLVAHEILHNFGLRHNFIASFDWKNFYFDDEMAELGFTRQVTPDDEVNWVNAEGYAVDHKGQLYRFEQKVSPDGYEYWDKVYDLTDAAGNPVKIDFPSERNYTTLMDYQDWIYDGLGPHDVFALRIAYTGLVELGPRAKTRTETVTEDTENGTIQKKRVFLQTLETDAKTGQPKEIELVGGRFIHYNDLLRAAAVPLYKGRQLWTSLSRDRLAALGIKYFNFCTDEDADGYPTCRRWDSGITAEEIVQNEIDSYNELYEMRQYRGDRPDFGASLGGHISRMFRIMVPLRQFLEETFYRAIYLKQPYIDHVMAAYKAYNFFMTIIKTPDADAEVAMDPQSRFETIQVPVFDPATGQYVLGADGQPVMQDQVIEKRPLEDIYQDFDLGQLTVRGTEYNKLIAMMGLASRNFGYSRRYNQANLKLSYYLFEKYFLGVDEPRKSPMINLLKEIMMDDLMPQTPEGLSLDTIMESDTTIMLRYYASIHALLDMDLSGNYLDENPATEFRVRMTDDFVSLPEDQSAYAIVEQPGASQYDLKYWTLTDSIVSYDMIKRLEGFNAVLNNKEFLTQAGTAWLQMKSTVDQLQQLLPQVAEIQAQLDQLNMMIEQGEAMGQDIPQEAYDQQAQLQATLAQFEGVDLNEQLTQAQAQLQTIEQDFMRFIGNLPDSVGTKDLNALYEGMMELSGAAYQLDQYIAQYSAMPDIMAQIQNMIDGYALRNRKLPMRDPLMAMMLSVVPAETDDSSLNQMKPDIENADYQKGNVYNSLGYLNTFFYMLNSAYDD